MAEGVVKEQIVNRDPCSCLVLTAVQTVYVLVSGSVPEVVNNDTVLNEFKKRQEKSYHVHKHNGVSCIWLYPEHKLQLLNSPHSL